MQFSEIIGLADIKQTLVSAVQNNHVAHAQLFFGREGSATLALVLAYATYLNCQAPTDTDSCGKCISCLQIKKFIYPDLHFVFPIANIKPPSQKGKSKGKQDDDEESSSRYSCDDFLTEWRVFLKTHLYGGLPEWAAMFEAENKQFIISVEEGRKIVSKLMLSSFSGGYKIMIIWLPENMNVNAANAILKILEEPPKKTIFLLVAHRIDKLLPTILSRNQIIAIRQFDDNEISTFLQAKYAAITPQLLTESILIADGNLAEAIRIIEKGQGNQQAYLEKWLRSCYLIYKDFAAVQALSEEFQNMSKEEQKNLLLYALNIFRQCIVVKSGNENLVRLATDTLNFVKKLASSAINENNIQTISQLLSEAIFHLERNANSRIMFVEVSFQLARAFRS
jgi:DNA polymerase III subunit delta'